eukprot:5788381-Pleurochrysis_carterae.AAC.1
MAAAALPIRIVRAHGVKNVAKRARRADGSYTVFKGVRQRARIRGQHARRTRPRALSCSSVVSGDKPRAFLLQRRAQKHESRTACSHSHDPSPPSSSPPSQTLAQTLRQSFLAIYASQRAQLQHNPLTPQLQKLPLKERPCSPQNS